MRTGVTEVQCQTALTLTGGFLYSFTHSLNPYIGCAFGEGGCGAYCYVAESPVGRFGPAPWGQWVKVKTNLPERLRWELRRHRDRESLRVFMASATDTYQKTELSHAISRRALSVLSDYPIGHLIVQTRSPYVVRDFDIIRALPFAWLSMTVETDSDEIRRQITPTCPSIDIRLRAMRHARSLGIRVQATVSPCLPHDSARFARLLDEAADRVVVDTFVAGDGSGGRRTARRPVAKEFEALGWGDWRDQSQAVTLYDNLKQVMGSDRVSWSSEGFNWS